MGEKNDPQCHALAGFGVGMKNCLCLTAAVSLCTAGKIEAHI